MVRAGVWKWGGGGYCMSNGCCHKAQMEATAFLKDPISELSGTGLGMDLQTLLNSLENS